MTKPLTESPISSFIPKLKPAEVAKNIYNACFLKKNYNTIIFRKFIKTTKKIKFKKLLNNYNTFIFTVVSR